MVYNNKNAKKNVKENENNKNMRLSSQSQNKKSVKSLDIKKKIPDNNFFSERKDQTL